MFKWLSKMLRLTTPNQRGPYGRAYPTTSNSGPYIGEDQAFAVAAYWACVRVIAGHLGQIPWRVFSGTREGESELAADHPADRLLNARPNPQMESCVWRELMVSWMLTWGNAYCEIERDASFRPMNLWPIEPWRVTPFRSSTGDGSIVYQIRNNMGAAQVNLGANDVLHFRGLGDSLEGWSVIRYAANAMGLSLTQEQSMASQMREGARPNLVVKPKSGMTISDEQKFKTYVNWFNDQLAGADKHGKALFMNYGFETEQLAIPNTDLQLLESRKFSAEDICRFTGVPPHKAMLMDRATFSNIEHQSIEFVQDTIMPWACRFEQQADRKLISRPRQYYSRLETNALIRGDMKAQVDRDTQLLSWGVKNINEVRAEYDLNPITGGDQHFVPLNMQVLEADMSEPEPAMVPPELEDDQQQPEEMNGNGRIRNLRRH